MRINRKRKKPVTETQMVSLADIAFLIIFFFMLSSVFMKDKRTVSLPVLPKAAETNSQISVTLDAQSQIFLEGQPVSSPELLESRLRELLVGKTKATECEVQFKCDRKQTYRKYRPIYEAIANAGGVISIMHDVQHGGPPH